MLFPKKQGKEDQGIVLELFLGAVILTGDLSDFRTVIPGDFGPLGELISGAVT